MCVRASITEERKGNGWIFSDGYYDDNQSMAVAADSDIKGFDDLVGKTVVVKNGTMSDQYATEIAAQYEAEGKAAAMKAKWEQEKEKAVAVTKAEQEFEVARLAALKAKEEAKKIEAEGMAKAAANRALVSAGLTPIERATIDKETAIGIAHELAQSNVSWVPTIMFGGNANGNNSAMDAVGLNMMLDVVNKMNKK